MAGASAPELDMDLVGVEAAVEGIDTSLYCASLASETPGALQGSLSYLPRGADGRSAPASTERVPMLVCLAVHGDKGVVHVAPLEGRGPLL